MREEYAAAAQEAQAHGREPSLVLFTHSEGSILGKLVMERLNETNPEIGQHTSIYAFGSPIILDHNLAKKVDVYISRWDLVGWVDVIGCLRNHDHVTILDPVGGFPGFDHAIMGKTYKKRTGLICNEIRSNWGL